FQEGGLPGTVGTDNSVAVAGNEFQADIFKKPAGPKAETYIIDTDHWTQWLPFIGVALHPKIGMRLLANQTIGIAGDKGPGALAAVGIGNGKHALVTGKPCLEFFDEGLVL